jgi:hypothetical protein
VSGDSATRVSSSERSTGTKSFIPDYLPQQGA